MKLAAMEGLYHGHNGQGFTIIGIVNPDKEWNDDKPEYNGHIAVPYVLSVLANHDPKSFVPGVTDIVNGVSLDANGDTINTVSYSERISMGLAARQALADYGAARNAKDSVAMAAALKTFRDNYKYFGYAYFTDVKEAIPPIGLTFTTFRIMVYLGGYFLLFYVVTLLLIYRKNLIDRSRWFYWVAMLSVPLMWVCSEAGWCVAEVGRQPWTIQDLLPTKAAISDIPTSSVVVTFWMFAAVFTLLLAAEVSIMVKYIEKKSRTSMLAPESLTH